jgi:flagellar hook-associated protein 1 FlgK
MAAGDTLGIGVSALLGFQRSLGTTSHNIANVNTEDYSRQRVELGTKPPQFGGYGYIGSGVDVKSVERVYSENLVLEVRNSTALMHEQESLNALASQLDNLVADATASISPVLQSFFDSVSDVSDEPSSLPARQVMLSEAEALVDRFVQFGDRFNTLDSSVNEQLTNSISSINSLASEIAQLNSSIVAASGAGAGAQPNDLLDQRDHLLRQLSEHVAVSAVEEEDGSINVFLGKGQLLVNRNQTSELTVQDNQFNPSQYDVALTRNNSTVTVTNQISGGVLGGALRFRDEVLEPARNALGRIAVSLAVDFNDQHQLGMDLQSTLGDDFFRVPNPVVQHNLNNTGTGSVDMTITDASSLTLSDYVLEYDGSDAYTLTRLTDNTRTSLNIPVGTTSTEVDGFTITIATEPDVDDNYLLQPTARGSETIGVSISDPTRIAAASPVAATGSLDNTGTGVVGVATVTDLATYVPDSYDITFANVTPAAVGAGTGTPVEGDADATLEYQLNINGVNIITQDEAGVGAVADIDALAAAINGAVTQTGVRAYVDSTGGPPGTLYLARDPASTVPITVTETLQATAGALEAGDTVTGYFGSALDDTTTSATITYAPTADSYVVQDGSAAVVGGGTYTSGADITFNGITTSVSGVPNFGDTFSVYENVSGVGDNTNALSLAGLRTLGSLDSGTATYQDAYGQLVARVGTSTHQAEINFEAQQSRLQLAESARQSLSGVNLDEEAANMLRFQQAYQAAARIISTADSMFQTLLDTVGR